MNNHSVNTVANTVDITTTGLGIRAELFEPVLNDRPPLGFLEAHSENYFGDSIARAKLLELREDYLISLHGVGLSLGRADNLDANHLKNLKALVNEVEPVLVSEHLAWSAYSHTHLPDLLPLPLTEQALAIICQHIDEMQETLGRQILLENPSNYLLFDQLQIPEPVFLNTVAERTGCGLLLDVNNVVVSAKNLQRDPKEYVEQIDSQYIGQYHLAGYTPVEKNGESLLIDTHNQTVYPEVWQLFEQTVDHHGVHPTLFEWDSDFPEFSVLLEECQKATVILSAGQEQKARSANSLTRVKNQANGEKKPVAKLDQIQENFIKEILDTENITPHAIEAHKPRIWVYQNNVYGATVEYLEAVFPAVSGVVGSDYFKQMARLFIKKKPPQKGNIHLYGQSFSTITKTLSGLKKIPYLKDLISYEWALHYAYYAVNNIDIDVSAMSQEELLTTDICFNDSVAIINSMFPLYEIHRQSLPDYLAKVSIDLSDSQDTLIVYKKDFEVQTKVLDQNELVFLKTIDESDNLLQAIEAVGGSIEPEAVSLVLSFVFENNLLMRRDIDKNSGEKSESVA